MPAATVNNAALWNSSTDPGITAFAPSIDGYVVTAAPGLIFDQGKSLKVSVLAGFNADEELLFLPRALPHATSSQYVKSAKSSFGPSVNASLRFYHAISKSQANKSATALVGDLVIRKQTFEILDRQVLINEQSSYGYYLTYTSPYLPAAAHSAEVNFFFWQFGTEPDIRYNPSAIGDGSGVFQDHDVLLD